MHYTLGMCAQPAGGVPSEGVTVGTYDKRLADDPAAAGSRPQASARPRTDAFSMAAPVSGPEPLATPGMAEAPGHATAGHATAGHATSGYATAGQMAAGQTAQPAGQPLSGCAAAGLPCGAPQEQPAASAQPAAPRQERRASPRMHVLQRGIIIFNNRLSTVECTIRNLSQGGARLKLAAPILLPEQFQLMFLKTRVERNVEIVWRTDREIGVRFTDC